MSRGDFWPAEAFMRPPAKPTLADIENPETFALLVNDTKLHSRREAMPQVEALMAAGWRFEIPSETATEPWQWYWRAPPKRANSAGRLYMSTQQAFNAMQKAAK